MIKWKKSDRGALIVCFVMAVALWVYVMNQVNPQITRDFPNIPVTLLHVDALEEDSLLIMQPEKPTVNVTLSGLRNTLNRVSPSQIIAEADLQGYTEGAVRVPVTIKQPADTTIATSSQRDILFSIERVVERTIPINVVTDGTKEDFKYNFTLEPERITISAPRSKANNVHSAIVNVEVGDRTESFTSTLPIQLLDADKMVVGGVNADADTVSVSTEVRKVKEVPLVIAHTGTLPDQVTILQESIEPNVVLVQGPDEIVSNLENVRTEAIDYASMTESGEREVQLQFPEGVKLVEDTTILYRYTVRTPVEQSYLIDRSTIDIQNLAEGYTANVQDGSSILVKLRAEEAIINELDRSKVRLLVNAQGLGVGEHTLPIQMEPIENVKIDQEQLEEITIVIQVDHSE